MSINGHAYGDRGILSNCSIEAAWKGGATHIVVIHCPNPPPRNRHGILGSIARGSWVSLGRLCRLEVERFQDGCPTLLLFPEVDLGSNGNGDFSRTAELMEQAKKWTDAFLEREGQEFTNSSALVQTAA